MSVQLKINGELKTFESDMPGSLGALLEQLGVDAATVVAEVDGVIIERAKFGSTVLRGGENIELIRFVGGG
ncbi:MAG: thiamine biosynthesis protein ThiS [Planctomycetes bacterium GWF2_50_10]|nr:MAG: thiamine biosynthesis protein ThiS [Planctomycetes bacterium GWF2_50_10]